MSNEPTYDMQPSNEFIKDNYFPLFLSEGLCHKAIGNDLGSEILNIWNKEELSRSRWFKRGVIDITWEEPAKGKRSIRTSLKQLAKDLIQKRKYDDSVYPPLPPTWLDSSSGIALPFCAPQNGSNKHLGFKMGAGFGPEGLHAPTLDREGIAYSSFQNNVERMLLIARDEVIRLSGMMFDVESGRWLFALMNYLNLLVTSVDITLMHLYYRGKYHASDHGWDFDENKIGSSVVPRMKDKFKWVYQITGHALDNAEEEMKRFCEIKFIRNHINHFDPPVFAITIEDVANWLNYIYPIGNLLRKIRKRIDSRVSRNILEMLLSKPVKFQPRDPGKPRFKQDGTGYASCFDQKYVLQPIPFYEV